MQLGRTRDMGRWANDPRGSGRRANARFSYNARTGVARLRAMRKLHKGEEVLVNYGREYWNRGKIGGQEQEEKKEEVNAIAQVDVVAELLKESELDAEYNARRKGLMVRGGSEPGAKVEGGLIWSEGRIVVPATERARTVVVHECHDAPTGGHLGRDKTVAAVKLRFQWVGVDEWVSGYVRTCVKCQQNKVSNQRPAGLLMPLPIPVRPGQQWGLDFVGPLPKTRRGYDGILTLVDRFSKLKHLVPINMEIGAKEAVGLVWREVIRLHGVPECLVHDRDPRFTAGFWTTFWKQLQMQLGVSTAYHPQTDGQTERENRTVGEMIRSFVNDEQTDWDEYLSVLELAMNSAKQASTGFSPFAMVYGREAPLPIDVKLKTPVSTEANPAVGELHRKLEEMWKRATESIKKAQERQKRVADAKRREVQFKVGDQGAIVDGEYKDGGIEGTEAIGEIRSSLHRTVQSGESSQCECVSVRVARINADPSDGECE